MRAAPSKAPAKSDNGSGKKVSTLGEIQRLQRERDERRKQMEQMKHERNLEEQRNKELGTPGDIDFQRMIRAYRETAVEEEAHLPPGEMKICICVRKRPISAKEIKKNDYDSITCINPLIVSLYEHISNPHTCLTSLGYAIGCSRVQAQGRRHQQISGKHEF
jgi:hypothetical protein